MMLFKTKNIPEYVEAYYDLRIRDWNRIEMSHEEGESGSFFVSLSAGKKVMRMDAGVMEQEKFTDVHLLLGSGGHPSTFTRRLHVIEKS